MIQLTMDNLSQAVHAAIGEKAKFFAIAVTVPGATGREVLINPKENFEAKLKYLQETYNHDLIHKTAPLQIVGFTYGDRYSAIQKDLLG